MIHIAFDIPTDQGPALRAAVEEMSARLGSKLEGKAEYKTEQAWTLAASALGALRAAVNKMVPDTHYNTKGGK